MHGPPPKPQVSRLSGEHGGPRRGSVGGCAKLIAHPTTGCGRDVAQFGSALDWGSRGRRFKSCRPDGRKSPLIQVKHLVSGLFQFRGTIFTLIL